MSELFHTICYQPIYNLLIFLYNIIPGNNLGVAIIFLTIIIKLLLNPFSSQAIKSQKALQDLQPKIEEIKQKFKDQKEKMGQAMMEFYKQEKINPFSSCLPLLIQFPFLIAVFNIFKDGFNSVDKELLYPFISSPEKINPFFLGINLSDSNILLAVLAGGAQFWQTKMMMHKKLPLEATKLKEAKDENMTAMMNKQMLYFMPILTIWIGATLPAGLTLYWFVLTLFMIIQQYFVFKKSHEAINK
ncbi:membrane protein insertase YidC [Candidatus Kuenenbacteria bacterium]|nr:membrane protein insertase YidC [Candidatus Kuenenbacteria bacterium]